MHINVRSIRNKVDEIDNLMASIENKFDVVCFTETWLSQTDHIPFFDGYRSQHLTRINQRGGGVSMYIKEKMRFNIMEEFSVINEDVECLAVHLEKATASVIYRPPTGDKETFCNFLDAVL